MGNGGQLVRGEKERKKSLERFYSGRVKILHEGKSHFLQQDLQNNNLSYSWLLGSAITYPETNLFSVYSVNKGCCYI